MYQPLSVLPADIQNDWMASLEQATPTESGVYRLVAARRTEARGFEGQRITVLVIDEDGQPIPGVLVAFSYSTAQQKFTLTPDFQWSPPPPHRAFIVPTSGSGQIDQIQGSGVKEGEPGGVTVYLLDPQHSSDIVRGAGMLADHTGLHLTYQLRRTGRQTEAEWRDIVNVRLQGMEAGIKVLQDRMGTLEAWVTRYQSLLEQPK